MKSTSNKGETVYSYTHLLSYLLPIHAILVSIQEKTIEDDGSLVVVVVVVVVYTV